MVDYRAFLGADAQALKLPWLSGPGVDAPGRRLRLTARPPSPGWYSFVVKGRTATPGERCEAGDLSALPKVRGWLWGERLVREGALFEPVALLPADEPPRFSPVIARRWHSGELLFDALEFESEVEGAVREALAGLKPLSTVKGAAAPLRAAYGFALVDLVGRRTGVRASPAEVRGKIGAIAEGGEAEAVRVLDALEAERALARRELAELDQRRTELELRAQVAAERAHRVQNASARAEEALERAGAKPESVRRLAEGQLEVVYSFMGERFISVADEHTLQVLDAGICLGHPPSDKLVTLDSLPSVIKEAIETGALVILRYP